MLLFNGYKQLCNSFPFSDAGNKMVIKWILSKTSICAINTIAGKESDLVFHQYKDPPEIMITDIKIVSKSLKYCASLQDGFQ